LASLDDSMHLLGNRGRCAVNAQVGGAWARAAGPEVSRAPRAP
jgi:hypothetical protein